MLSNCNFCCNTKLVLTHNEEHLNYQGGNSAFNLSVCILLMKKYKMLPEM